MSNSYGICRPFPAMSLIAIGLLTLASTAISTGSAQAIESKHGCVEVTAQSINIRSKNSAKKGEIVTTAQLGEVLAKRGPTCPIRRFWCPVRNAKGVEGWAAKEFIKNTECR